MKSDSDTYRSVRDSFWTDPDILDMTPEEKLFYVWLFTNSHLDTCGCYQVSVRTIEYETALPREQVLMLLQSFISAKRILYCEENKEIILLKWKKNNEGFFKENNKNSIKAIRLGADKIKTPEFKDIVLIWLGVGEAPTLPPTPEARIQPKPKPEPEPKDKTQQHAREQLAVVVDEHREDLLRLFPEIDLPVAVEKLLHHFRESPRLVDPWMTALKWFQREFKPASQPLARASPAEQKGKGVLKQEAAVAASQEALILVRRLRDEELGRAGAESSAGFDGDAGDRTAYTTTASVVSAGVG